MKKELVPRMAARTTAAVRLLSYSYKEDCQTASPRGGVARAGNLLANLFKKAAIAEMIHVERAAERILFLRGEVEMKTAEPVQKIHEVRAMLERAARMEEESAKEYNEWANLCGANNDSASKRLFEDLVAEEETHYDQYMTEVENMEKFGDRYLALQSIERSKSISNPRPAE
jgi:bacterioferritin